MKLKWDKLLAMKTIQVFLFDKVQNSNNDEYMRVVVMYEMGWCVSESHNS